MEKTNQNLFELRKERKLTRADVAKLTGIGEARLTTIELRGDTVRPAELVALCKLYKVRIETVVEQ